jgi:hypothetical protein
MKREEKEIKNEKKEKHFLRTRGNGEIKEI